MDAYEDMTIILPTYNEGGNIQPMLESLLSLYPGVSIIVADDDSSDGTVESVLDLAAAHPRTTLLRRDPQDRGLTASVMEGITSAHTRFFVVMDADFQHPPECAVRMHAELLEGADLVVGVRDDIDNLGLPRKLASWGAHFLASTYLRAKGRAAPEDTMSGFFGGRTDLCQEVIRKDGCRFERAGFKVLFDLLKFLPQGTTVAEVSYTFSSRRSGRSKLSSRTVLSILRQCGTLGRGVALTADFLLINVIGRFLSALFLGLVLTFWVMGLLDMPYDGHVVTSIVLAFVMAMAYLVITNKYLLGKGRRNGLMLGAKLVFTGFTGYLISLYIFYMALSTSLTMHSWPMFLGFGMAYLWNSLSSVLPEN